MKRASDGFTIVELLIVIVVIAILAVLAVIGYNGVSDSAREALLKTDLSNGAKQLQITKTTSDTYPVDASGLKKAASTSFEYANFGPSFCLTASSVDLPGTEFYITEDGVIQDGACPPLYLQEISDATCSTTRTLATDARDNRTYWVQRLSDGNCWMLTNLAYAGGGTNTYGDVKTIQEGSAQPSSYTLAYYYIPTGANPTLYPTQPSQSTDGGATNPQYGYLYNWCGAMGAQLATSSCANATTPLPNTTISICPSGWRLPTGSTGGEIATLNTAINGGSLITDAGLRSAWLAQQGGYWWDGYILQGGESYYWSNTQHTGTANNAHHFYFDTGFVYSTSYDRKPIAMSVRCVAM